MCFVTENLGSAIIPKCSLHMSNICCSVLLLLLLLLLLIFIFFSLVFLLVSFLLFGRLVLSTLLLIMSSLLLSCVPFWRSGWCLTALELLPYIWGRKKGSFFKGELLPQKLDLKSPIERQYKPFQKHVPSYQVKISKSCFVLATPTLL
jgi:hypothetical protein